MMTIIKMKMNWSPKRRNRDWMTWKSSQHFPAQSLPVEKSTQQSISWSITKNRRRSVEELLEVEEEEVQVLAANALIPIDRRGL